MRDHIVGTVLVVMTVVAVIAALFIAFLPDVAMGGEVGYEFETESEQGAIVRVKGMFSKYKLYWSKYEPWEMDAHEDGGMLWHAAMHADPHDWLWLHVDPPEQGVLWGRETVFQIVTAWGETLYGGPILLTDSPLEFQLYSARERSVFLGPKAEYGRNKLGYICVAVGFLEGSLRADHGSYWAEFDTLRSFVVLEGGKDAAEVVPFANPHGHGHRE